MISPSEAASYRPRVSFDPRLIAKYSVPAPRYTSYPPATQFTTDLSAVKIDDAFLDDNAKGAGPVSLYFHLPFCESRCWYCGCTTIITKRKAAAGEYIDLLKKEIALTAARMDLSRPVTQLHLGGGTPTFFSPDELRRLSALVHDTFRFAPDAEISVEIDPRRLTRDHVVALRELGAWRASIGVQDTNRQVQLAIHRYQPQAINEQSIEWMRAAGFRSINVDLIYGLPVQNPESFAKTLEDVLTLKPERLSVFSYAHVPWIKPAQRIFEDRDQLPSADEKLAMFILAHEKLTEAGYCDIGLDHFARPDDELALAQAKGTLHRNFQGYSTQAGASLYSFGVSSISQTVDTYRQNFKDLRAYEEALAAGRLPIERGLRLSAEDQRRRTIIMKIMCDRGLNFSPLSQEFGFDFATRYATELQSLSELQADGLVKVDGQGLTVTPAGVPMLRVVAMHFDATFKAAPRKHAQVI